MQVRVAISHKIFCLLREVARPAEDSGPTVSFLDFRASPEEMPSRQVQALLDPFCGFALQLGLLHMHIQSFLFTYLLINRYFRPSCSLT